MKDVLRLHPADEIERLRLQVADLQALLLRWQNLIEAANILVVDLNADGTIRSLNLPARQIFPLASDGKKDYFFTNFLVAEDRVQAQQAFSEAIRSRLPSLTLQCRVQLAQGDVFQGYWTAVLQYDSEGNYIGASIIAYDMGSIKPAPAEADESRALLQLIIDSLPQAIFWKDRDLRFLGANRRFLEDGGVASLADLIGKTDFDMPWAEHAHLYRADDLAVMEHGPKLNIEEPLILADGSQVWLRTDKVPLMYNGQVKGVLGIYKDVTEEKQRAEELLVYKTLIDNAPDGVIVADTNQVITYANAAMNTMLGYQSLVGMPGHAILSTQSLQRIPELVNLALNGAKTSVNIDFIHRDGSSITMNSAGLAIFNEAGQLVGFASINRDISEQLRLEEERRHMQEQVIAAQQAMLRELSTPLLPIADQVVAMPIIGAIDSNRAAQIMETLLEGVARYRARIAILDITGVRVVDTQVAGALMQAAQAARLLGAQVVITGIGPEVAQTLVHIGADLTSLIAKPNLQEGIAFALRQRNGDRALVGV